MKNTNKDFNNPKNSQEDMQVCDDEITKQTMLYVPENISNPYVYKLMTRITSFNHRDYILLVISLETGIKDPSTLNHLYSKFMESNKTELLNDIFYEC